MEEKNSKLHTFKYILDITKSILSAATVFGFLSGSIIMYKYAENEGFSFLEMVRNAPIAILATSLLFSGYIILTAIFLTGIMFVPYCFFRWFWPERKSDGTRYDKILLRPYLVNEPKWPLLLIFLVCGLATLLILLAVATTPIKQFNFEKLFAIASALVVACTVNMILFDRKDVLVSKWLWAVAPSALLIVIALVFSENLIKNTVTALGARPDKSDRILVTDAGYNRISKIAATYGLSFGSCEISGLGFILRETTVVLNGFGDNTLIRVGSRANGRIIPIANKDVDMLRGQASEVNCLSAATESHENSTL